MWYRQNRRMLPWRRTNDPYRIWIAEVMLQQTRVAAVLPYYRRFLKRFPTMRALARAPEGELLKHWAGLGYYSRARNLQQAAQQILARHRGRFPEEFEEALSLPGVGPYTAAAVLSMAYGKPLAVLDGNVARVLARLGAVRGDLRAPKRWRKLEEQAQALLEPRASRDWNQAMMELGATICTPRAPRCAECPVARGCRAYALGLAESLPEKREKRATVNLRIAAAVLLDSSGRTLLIRSPDGPLRDLFSRMWQFPAVEIDQDPEDPLRRHLDTLFDIAGVEFEALPRARHAVTYRAIELVPYLVRLDRLPSLPPAARGDGGTQILRPLLAEVESLPASNATRKIARAARGLVERARAIPQPMGV